MKVHVSGRGYDLAGVCAVLKQVHVIGCGKGGLQQKKIMPGKLGFSKKR